MANKKSLTGAEILQSQKRKRKALQDKEKKFQSLIGSVKSLADLILQTWNETQDALGLQRTFEEFPEVVKEHRRNRRDRLINRFLIILILIGESLISYEMAGIFANSIMAFGSIPERFYPLIWGIGFLIVAGILIGGMFYIKSVYNESRENDALEQKAQKLKRGLIHGEDFEAFSIEQERKKKRHSIFKCIYLCVVMGFYALTWSGLAKTEKLFNKEIFDMPTFDLSFTQNSVSTEVNTAEKEMSVDMLPQSTITGGFMILLLVIHGAYLFLSPSIDASTPTDMATFHPTKHLKEIHRLEEKLTQSCRDLVSAMHDERNKEFITDMMYQIPPTTCVVINHVFGRKVLPTEKGDTLPVIGEAQVVNQRAIRFSSIGFDLTEEDIIELEDQKDRKSLNPPKDKGLPNPEEDDLN